MRIALLFCAVVAVGALAAAALLDRSEATTQAALIRPVDVTITDRGIELSRSSLDRGLIAEFRVVNESSERRNFVVGVESTDLLAPGEREKLIVDLQARGQLAYRVTVNCGRGFEGLFTVV
ncbi:MAG: hypothetical protein GEU88_11035 [Solirubrobacterales bacterium]|nr:hypothetical protein [Solirubrobacterales bacterium]